MKSAKKVFPSDLKALQAFLEDYPEAKALLLYQGKEKLKIGKIFCCPVEEFLKNLTPDRWIEI